MRKIGILDKIDMFLDRKKQSERLMLQICIFTVTSFLIYTFIYPIVNNFYEDTETANLILNQNLNQSLKNQEILSQIKDGDLLKIKSELGKIKELNEYFETKFKELNTLNSNINWTIFLRSLTDLAQKNDIQILDISNSFSKLSQEEFNNVLEINLKFNADFANVVKYTSDIEEINSAIYINEILLSPLGNRLCGEIKILIYKMSPV